jgi:hypothetical protein
MRQLLHRALALTLAFALVASAAAWRQCTGLQLAETAIAANAAPTSSHQHDAAAHGAHDHHAQQGPADQDTPAADHGCMKCCSMCSVASVLTPELATVTFTVTAAMFAGDGEKWLANDVAVDPGIPKRIV